MGSLVAELAEKLSSATNNLDFDEQTLFLNTSADTVGIGTNAPGAKLDVRGSALFNEAGADADFRIEGDSQTHLFFLDASTDRIGINSATPGVQFDVVGATTITGATIHTGTTQLTGAVTVGVDDTGYDVKLFGDTASRYWLWDTSADGVVQRGTLTVGVNDTGHDVKFFGATAGAYWLWDESADGVVQIGTLTVGVDDAGHDVIFYGATASSNMTWDESEDDLVLNDARLFLDQDDNVTSLEIDSEATSSHCININSAGTTGRALYIESNALTTGDLMKLYMNSSDTGSRSLLNLVQDNSSASGTTVLRVQSDGTGDIVNLFDGGTEVFTVLDGGKVGIGTASPDVIFHVFSSSASIGPYIESTYGDASLKLIAKNDGTSMLDFGDSDSVNVGRLQYDHSNNWLAIKTAGTEAIRIISDQKVGIGSTAPNATLDVVGTFSAYGYRRMAWGNFNQQSGSQVLATPDHNVSSVTDIGVGLTTVTLSITMGNTTYNVVSGMAYSATGSGVGNTGEYSVGAVYNKSTTAFSIVGLNHNDGSTSLAVDLQYICFICIGD